MNRRIINTTPTVVNLGSPSWVITYSRVETKNSQTWSCMKGQLGKFSFFMYLKKYKEQTGIILLVILSCLFLNTVCI